MATIAHVSGLTVEAVESDHESLTKYEEHKIESRADEEEDTGVSDMYVEAVSGAKLGIKAVFNANFEDHHDVYMVIKLDGRKAGSRSIERHEFHLPREHAVAQIYEDENLKTYRGDFRFSGLEVCDQSDDDVLSAFKWDFGLIGTICVLFTKSSISSR